MSSASEVKSVKVVKAQLRVGGPLVTCVDVTPKTARLGRLLEVSTLQVHKVPLDVVRLAPDTPYDAAQMVSLLYRVAQQCDATHMPYAKDEVQQVTQSLTQIVTAVKPAAQDGRYSRRLSVD